MPCQVEWLDKPHIVFFKLSGDVTEDEFVGAIDQAIALANEVPDTAVHTLIEIDAQGPRTFPPLPVLSREIKRLLQESPNRDMSTVYGVSALVRYILELLMRVTPLRVKVFDTREEALSFIRQMIARDQQVAASQDRADE